MNILNAKFVPTLKRVAKNVDLIVQQKAKIAENIAKLEGNYHVKLATLQAEYDALVQQQDLFEAPIKQLTGGYSTEDLITVEINNDKGGKSIRTYTLKYPDTILPPKVEEGFIETTSTSFDVNNDLPFVD